MTGTKFALSEALRAQLFNMLNTSVPEQTYVAMDYTLDWLHAALTCYFNGGAWKTLLPINSPLEVSATQEDVDLLIAWDDSTGKHLVLIEAKGFSGWSNKVMHHKAQRLGVICDERVRQTVDVHFVLAGHTPTQGLDCTEWPAWMSQEGRLHFLTITPPEQRWAVQRVTSNGEASKQGKQWRTVPRA